MYPLSTISVVNFNLLVVLHEFLQGIKLLAPMDVVLLGGWVALNPHVGHLITILHRYRIVGRLAVRVTNLCQSWERDNERISLNNKNVIVPMN